MKKKDGLDHPPPILQTSQANMSRSATCQYKSDLSDTPRKKTQNHEFLTPRKINSQNNIVMMSPHMLPPLQKIATPVKQVDSPSKVSEIGPTPQKFGKVLGLLDVDPLTPVKPSSTRKSLDGCASISTPKRKRADKDEGDENVATLETPKKDPAVVLIPDTPVYLNTGTSRVVETLPDSEYSDSDEEVGITKPRFGLSSMIAEYRELQQELQENILDENEEILRELEAEELGFDPESLAEEPGRADEVNPEGHVPLKKKGQKRSTRRHVSKLKEDLHILLVCVKSKNANDLIMISASGKRRECFRREARRKKDVGRRPDGAEICQLQAIEVE